MNKRCVITGHTSGLGLALFEHFKNKGWDVEGYSRSNGYDLNLRS
jgi:NAD(P)-dependent dehydrogenase (short-subunit alcohol dehydrogenase family)